MVSIQHKVIVKAWVEKHGKYLLAQRGDTEKHHAGVWSLPGGNVDNEVGDSIIERTLKRELDEEVGIEIQDGISLVYTNGFIKDSDGSHVINLTFLCRWKSGEAKPLEDTAKVAWYSLKELKALPNPPDFLAKEIAYLSNFLERKNYV